MSSIYYDPAKLLNSLDATGQKPELFFAVSPGRGPGKTFSFSKWCIEGWRYYGKKFALICRNKTEVGGTYSAGVLDGYLKKMHPDWTITEKTKSGGLYSEIWTRIAAKPAEGENPDEPEENVHIGYLLPISMAGKLKNYSSTLCDIRRMFMDEFMTDPPIKPKEVQAFINLHESLARGGDPDTEEGVYENGYFVPYIPVVLASNSLTIQNEFFRSVGLTSKIQPNTKFFKGDGYVFQKVESDNITEIRMKSGFNRAFANNAELRYAKDNSWVNDDYNLVRKPDESWGRSEYVGTLIQDEEEFGIRCYASIGIYYINRSVDKKHPTIYSTGACMENISIIQTGELYITLRNNLFRGQVFFSDLSVKTSIMRMMCM